MRKEIAQLGIIARGVTFTLMAVLTGLTLYEGAGGKISGTKEAFAFIADTFYGKLILLLISIGMLIYVIWRINLTLKVDAKESFWDKVRLKANHLGIALIYLAFIGYALNLIFGFSNSDEPLLKNIVDRYGERFWFEIIVFLIGAGVVGKGIFQFYIAYKQKFLELIEDSTPPWAKKSYIFCGVIGYIARGIIYTTLGYLIGRSSVQLYGNPSKSPAEAMQYLEFIGGEKFLFLLAAGLFIFSIFVFLKAKYRNVESLD